MFTSQQQRLLLLLCVCVWLSGVNATQPIDVRGATGHWLEINANVFDGPCLSAPTLLASYPSQVYRKNITLASSSWDGHIIHTWITKILIEEVIGYGVNIYDRDEDSSPATLDNIRKGVISINVEWWDDRFPQYDSYVYDQMVVVDYGELGSFGQDGIYTTTYTIGSNPGEYLDFWRGYQDPAAHAIYRAASWRYLTDPRNGVNMLLDDDGVFVCQSQANYTALGTPLGFGGCAGGMFVPPACAQNATRDCTVVYHFDPFYDNGTLAQWIVNNNMNFTIAYLNGMEAYMLYLSQTVRAPLLFYFDGPDTLLLASCTDPVTLVTSDCFQLIEFAVSNGLCDSMLDPLSPPECTWIPALPRSLAGVLPSRLIVLMQGVKFTGHDDAGIYQNLYTNFSVGGTNDYKRVACDWIQNNEARWQTWISPPEACELSDMQFKVGTCDSTTLYQPVVWSWTPPHSCVGGTPLVTNDRVACVAFPDGSGAQSGIFLACAILFLGVLLIAAVQSKHLYRKTKSTTSILPLTSLMVLPFCGSLILMVIGSLMHALQVTESVCVAKLIFLGSGFTVLMLALACISERLHFVMSSIIAVSKSNRDVYLCLGGFIAVVLLSVISTVAAGNAVVTTEQLVTGGGAPVVQNRCDISQNAGFVLWILIAANVVVVMFTAQRIRLCIGRIRSNMYKNRPAALALHKAQTLTVLLTEVVAIGGGVVLIAAQQAVTQNLDAAIVIIACVFVMVILLSAAFLGPTFLLHRQTVRYKAEKERKKRGEHNDAPSETSVSDRGQELSTLAGAISDPLGLIYLQQYSEMSLETENIAFLLALQSYINKLKFDNITVVEVIEGMKELHTLYIHNSATMQINISSKQRQDVEDQITKLIASVPSLKEHGIAPKSLLHDLDVSIAPSPLPTTVAPYSFDFLRAQLATPTKVDSPEARPFAQASISKKKTSAFLSPIASSEFKQKARAIFDTSAKEVFSLMSVNIWPRFLQSKQASRANDILMWCSNFQSYTEKEKVAVIMKLIKTYERGSRNGKEGDSRVSHFDTKASVFALTSQCHYAMEREDSTNTTIVSRPRSETPGATPPGAFVGGSASKSPVKGPAAAPFEDGDSVTGHRRSIPSFLLENDAETELHMPQLRPKIGSIITALEESPKQRRSLSGPSAQPHLSPKTPVALQLFGSAGAARFLSQPVPDTPGGSENARNDQSPSAQSFPGQLPVDDLETTEKTEDQVKPF